MNSFRYGVALVGITLLPPSMLVWFIIHPLVGFWRKVGLLWTYLTITIAVLAGAGGLYSARRVLLSVEFGSSWPLLFLGILCLAVAARLRVNLHRHFSNRQLMGLPELAPNRYPQRLVTEGLHALVRHPRYLQFLLAMVGYALLANYLVLYLAMAVWVPAIWLIVILEEKELRARFGPAYDDYCRRVPRFIPRWRRDS
jgi:protein-S-isoprenylcysteine O-methyltransferase Ste14